MRPTSRRRADRGTNQAAKLSTHTREVSQSGFSEMLARNIMDRGESLGINRAIFNTVSELRVRQISSAKRLILTAFRKTYRISKEPSLHGQIVLHRSQASLHLVIRRTYMRTSQRLPHLLQRGSLGRDFRSIARRAQCERSKRRLLAPLPGQSMH